MIRGVLFDKDGTLFDFGATWEAWSAAFLLRLCEGDQDRAMEVGASIGFDLMARKFSRDSIVIAGTPDEVVDVLTLSFPHMPRADLLNLLNEEAEAAPQSEAVPLVPFLLDLRGKGLQLGLATNDAEAPARTHLGRSGITQYFDFIAGFDSGHGAKPGPGQMHAFAAETGLETHQIAMVGDSLHDLHAGRAAGMACVGVLTGLASADELRPFADVVLPDIGHLSDWIDQQG